MRFLKYIALVFVLAWTAEDAMKFVDSWHDGISMNAELVGEEKVDKSEYEIREFVEVSNADHLKGEARLSVGYSNIIYKAPVLSIPDVPPEHVR